MVWVQFKRDFEDGYGKYQAGGKYDIHPAKYDVYTTQYYMSQDGATQERPPRPRGNPVCVKCEPPDSEPAGKGRSGRMGFYRFIDSVATNTASFAANQVYELPVEIGDKYVRRGIAENYRRTVTEEQPETAMRPSGRK